MPSMPLVRLRQLCDSLDREESLVDGFFQRSPDLLAVIDHDGSFIKTSRSWNKLPGWDCNDNLFDFVRPDCRVAFRDMLASLSDHDVNSFDCAIGTVDDGYVDINFSATRWRDETGTETEKSLKELERKLEKADETIEKVAKDLHGLNSKAMALGAAAGFIMSLVGLMASIFFKK